VKTLRIRVDTTGATPVNRQIVDQIRTHLVDGALVPGDVLPSVRRLAVDLGVHFNTVADAYRTLADEGWLDVAQGRGARVCARASPSPNRELKTWFRDRLRQLVAEARAQGLPAPVVARELVAQSESVTS